MSFLDSLEVNTNKNSRTLNGAVTNDSTLDAVLDFFSQAGAMRGKELAAYNLFKKAYAQDKNLAIKTLFYLRDIRGGQGERSVFNYIFNKLNVEDIDRFAIYIPEFGRWDEFPINEKTIHIIEHQLKDDLRATSENRQVSLLAKWLPSENTSSVETRKKAKEVMKLLNMKPSQYRRTLSKLRGYIALLETKMSQKEWGAVDYSKIPAQAHKKHVKAFYRNDETRYQEYLSKVEKGEEKINSGTLFTYDIYDMVFPHSYRSTEDDSIVRSATALWNALPDYTKGDNALVMADVSGSMTGRPMSVSVSLATYFAERNEGSFKGKYLTFTDVPRVVSVIGNNIKEKFECVQYKNVGYNTNIQAGFDAILNAAIESKSSQEDMPSVLYIISDMQFDDHNIGGKQTNFEVAKSKFEEAGYKLPHIVFWNVNSYGDSPATKFDKNVTLVSGFNQSTFQYVVAGKTPIESMMDILNSERYAKITV